MRKYRVDGRKFATRRKAMGAVLRFLMAVEAGASVLDTHWVYCQEVVDRSGDPQSGIEQQRKPMRRDEFLKTMEALVPRAALRDEIAVLLEDEGYRVIVLKPSQRATI